MLGQVGICSAMLAQVDPRGSGTSYPLGPALGLGCWELIVGCWLPVVGGWFGGAGTSYPVGEILWF